MKLSSSCKTPELCSKKKMKNSKLFLFALLGVLAAFGPFVTDMYLPALPAMTSYFHTTASMIQLGLTTSMLGLALGQIIVGPLSDKYGRRRPLLVSLGVFVISTVGCIWAPDVNMFVLLRFVQGMAGAGGIVISRSVATDCFSGKELARSFAMISAVNGLAPICAPVAGGVMLKYTSWQGIFVALLLLGMLLLLFSLGLQESLPQERRSKASAWTAFRAFGPLLVKRRFMGYVLLQACTMGVVFAYISSSPFILQNHFRLSPLAYSLCFGGNAVALIIGTTLAVLFRSPRKGALVGTVGLFLFALVTAATLVSDQSLAVFESALFVMLFFGGLILTTSTTLALDTERRQAGSASAILGAMTFVAGGIVSPLVGLGDILTATACIMVISALLAMLLAWRSKYAEK